MSLIVDLLEAQIVTVTKGLVPSERQRVRSELAHRLGIDSMPVYTEEGATFTPWTNGFAVGFKVTAVGKPTRYVYLNPSTGNDERDINETNTFVYLAPEDGLDDTTNQHSVCFVDIWKD